MSTGTFSDQHILQRVDAVDSNLAGATHFLADSLMKLASDHPLCSGMCQAGSGVTCTDLEDTITELIPALAEALLAAKEAVSSFGRRLREREPISAAERAEIEQGLVDHAVDLDSAAQGLRAQGRRLGEIPLHRDAAATIAYITICLIPPASSLGDLIEVLLS